MKRVALVLVCLALAAPAWAMKSRRIQRQPLSPSAPTTVTISGSPLTIVVGNDTSLQVYNSNVPGTGQFYPPDCAAGETADAGTFMGLAGVVYGPDFDNHPCGSASNSYTAWTPVSMTPVTGTGTSGDPFTVVIVANAALTGLQLTETLTYVNGAAGAVISLSFGVAPPPGAPAGASGGATVDVFVGSDLYLADSDSGFSFASAVAAGGHGANPSCQQLQYSISWQGTTPATAWTAQGFGSVWDEISAGTLDDAVDPTCIDNGAALEWAGRIITPGAPAVIDTGVDFTGQAVPVGAAVPTISVAGVAALVLLLAVVGYVLARKTSLGA